MNNPDERSLEEWSRLRREVAMAEQQLASQTHELLREKAKNEQLRVDLLVASRWTRVDYINLALMLVAAVLVGFGVGARA